LNNPSFEEAWAYIPKKSKWVEIGKNSKSYKIIGKVHERRLKIDGDYLEKLMLENNELIVYHFHLPLPEVLTCIVKNRKQKGNPMNEEDISKLEREISFNNVKPTRSDILNMIANSLLFYDIHPKGKITYKICSEQGITEFNLTKKGKKDGKNGKKNIEFFLKFEQFKSED